MQMLTLIMPLRLVSGLLPSVTDGLGRPDISVKMLAFATIVMCPAFALGGMWGLVGLSVAWALAYPVVFAANLIRSLPLVNLGIKDALRAMARPALCSLGMFGSVTLTRELLPLPSDSLPLLAALITTGVITYIVATLVFNRKLCVEFLALFRK